MSKEFLNLRPAYTLPEEFFRNNDLRLQTTVEFGDYSIEVLNDLFITQPAIPIDAVVIGDNWKMSLMWLPNPQSQTQEALKKRYSHPRYAKYFLIQRRHEDDDSFELETITDIAEEVRKNCDLGYYPKQMLNKFTIIDRSSIAFPLLADEGIKTKAETNWGSLIKLYDYTPYIYVIRNVQGPYIQDPYA